ncbi:hypothetical protein HRbin37_00272 [bacterium HR37]|nr:hypothetical protein HRbin37_00272 [bacterium HR37]
MKDLKEELKIVVLANDLFFSSKIKEAVKSLNLSHNLEFVKDEAGLYDLLHTANNFLIVFDLNLRTHNVVDTIKRLNELKKEKRIHIIGYIPHVQTHLYKNALEAGCDAVFPRSQFSKKIKDIIKSYINL